MLYSTLLDELVVLIPEMSPNDNKEWLNLAVMNLYQIMYEAAKEIAGESS